ncbi:MAG: hypothetical protein ACK4ND_05440, partial [Cytophagaceae bacterium]
MRIILVCCIVVLILSTNSQAQQHKVITADTLIGGFIGKEKYYVQAVNDTIKDGNYSFSSLLLKNIENDAIRLRELNISGKYHSDQSQGAWKYQFFMYSLDELSIKRGYNVATSYNLTGVEDEYLINYKNGNFDGRAQLSRKELKNGRYLSNNQIAIANYTNDTLMGGFYFESEGKTIKGKTNNEGFFDGIIELKYTKNEHEVLEIRNYNNGFLVELEKKDLRSGETFLKIIYEDVIAQLQKLSSIGETLNYKISEDGFGVKFNLGYPLNNRKVSEQAYGNELLESSFHTFDSIHNIRSGSKHPKSITKLTRRFQYVYPDDVDSLTQILLADVKNFKNEVDVFIKKPNVILRKNNSDTLYRDYKIIEHIYSKIEIIDQVLDKITNGYFDFRYRNIYYKNGIEGLNIVDTIRYTYKEKEHKIPFLFQETIDSPEDLIENLNSYTQELKKLTLSTMGSMQKSL